MLRRHLPEINAGSRMLALTSGLAIVLSGCSGALKPHLGTAEVTRGPDDPAGVKAVDQATTDVIAPDAFSITGPAPSINTPTPEITWSAALGAVTYGLKIDKTAGCPSPLETHEDVTETKQITAILTDGTYVVCLSAKGGNGLSTTASNDGYAFTIGTSPPGAFSITAPLPASNTPAPTLSWSVSQGLGPMTYDVALSSNQDCSAPSQSYSGLSTTDQALSALANGTYYACVTAKDEFGNRAAAANSPYIFTVYLANLGSFVVTAPATPTNNTTPTVSWTASTGAASYKLDITNDSACSTWVQSFTGLTGTSQALTSLSDGTYYACVVSQDGYGNVAKAPAYKFAVAHFVAGQGYALFQHNGLGAAGAANATKNDYVASNRVDSNGRYVLAGYSKNSAGGNEATIWRYNANGSLDTSFGSGTGYVTFQHNGLGAAGAANATKDDEPNTLQIDSDGRYVLAGYSKNSAGGQESAIWRYNGDGSLDTTFGSGAGYILFQHNGLGAAGAVNAAKNDSVLGLQIDSQGRLVVVGVSTNSVGRFEAAIWRYNADGSLDTSFGSGAGYTLFQHNGLGVAGASNTTKTDIIGYLQIDSNGRYVLAGYATNAAGGWENALLRYNSDGSIDTSFGSGSGYALFQHNGLGMAGAANAAKSDAPTGLHIDLQGRYVLAGQSLNAAGGSEIALWRYNSDGTLDPTLGNGTGYVLFQHGGLGITGETNASKYDATYGLQFDSTGHYVMAAMSQNTAGGYELGLLRYNADGTLDTGFGSGAGYVLFQSNGLGAAGASNASKYDWPLAGIQIDAQGRYVLAGSSTNAAGGSELAIWSYLPTGALDQ